MVNIVLLSIIKNMYTVGLNSEIMVAGLALLVSIITAIITFMTFRIQRIHNQKSLRPILYVAAYDYINCLKVELKNEGVGPAILTQIKVEMNEHEVKPSIYKWMPELPEGMSYSNYLTRSADIPMIQGKTITMLEIGFNSDDLAQRNHRDKMRGVLRQLTIKIDYKDIYENKMPLYIRKLDLYSRTDDQ